VIHKLLVVLEFPAVYVVFLEPAEIGFYVCILLRCMWMYCLMPYPKGSEMILVSSGSKLGTVVGSDCEILDPGINKGGKQCIVCSQY